jgi:hypothetical protein
MLTKYVNVINPFEMQISLALGRRSISSTGEYLKVDDASASKAIADGHDRLSRKTPLYVVLSRCFAARKRIEYASHVS